MCCALSTFSPIESLLEWELKPYRWRNQGREVVKELVQGDNLVIHRVNAEPQGLMSHSAMCVLKGCGFHIPDRTVFK